MDNAEGDMSHVSDWYRISDDHFLHDTLPNLSPTNLIVILHHPLGSHSTGSNDPSALHSLVSRIVSQTPHPSLPRFALVSLQCRPVSLTQLLPPSSLLFEVSLLSAQLLSETTSLLESSAKAILNAISTGAHILKGKVLGNTMIDVSISNNKLFYRGVEILQRLLGLDNIVATNTLLRAIYMVDEVTEAIATAPISHHYRQAIDTPKVMPRAFLLGSGHSKTVSEANAALVKEPIIRKIISTLVLK